MSVAATSGMISGTFTGLSGSGAVSAPGLVVGDFVVRAAATILGSVHDVTSSFEPVISVDDEIQQIGGAPNGDTVTILIIRAG